MWRRLVCCNCQVDGSDQYENGQAKPTINNDDGMFLSNEFSIQMKPVSVAV
jgi:hypothetical protein